MNGQEDIEFFRQIFAENEKAKELGLTLEEYRKLKAGNLFPYKETPKQVPPKLDYSGVAKDIWADKANEPFKFPETTWGKFKPIPENPEYSKELAEKSPEDYVDYMQTIYGVNRPPMGTPLAQPPQQDNLQTKLDLYKDIGNTRYNAAQADISALPKLNPTEAAISKMPSFLNKYNEASQNERMSRLMAGLSKDIGTGASLALQSGAHIRSGAQPFQFGPSGVMSAGVENAESAKRDVLFQEEYDPNSETSKNLREIAKKYIPELSGTIGNMSAGKLKEAFPFLENVEGAKFNRLMKQEYLNLAKTREGRVTNTARVSYIKDAGKAYDQRVANMQRALMYANQAEQMVQSNDPMTVQTGAIALARMAGEVGNLARNEQESWRYRPGLLGLEDKLYQFTHSRRTPEQVAEIVKLIKSFKETHREFLEDMAETQAARASGMMEKAGFEPMDPAEIKDIILGYGKSGVENVSTKEAEIPNSERMIRVGKDVYKATPKQMQDLKDDGIKFSIEQ